MTGMFEEALRRARGAGAGVLAVSHATGRACHGADVEEARAFLASAVKSDGPLWRTCREAKAAAFFVVVLLLQTPVRAGDHGFQRVYRIPGSGGGAASPELFERASARVGAALPARREELLRAFKRAYAKGDGDAAYRSFRSQVAEAVASRASPCGEKMCFVKAPHGKAVEITDAEDWSKYELSLRPESVQNRGEQEYLRRFSRETAGDREELARECVRRSPPEFCGEPFRRFWKEFDEILAAWRSEVGEQRAGRAKADAAEDRQELLRRFSELASEPGCDASLGWISCVMRGGRAEYHTKKVWLPMPRPHVICSGLVTPFNRRGEALSKDAALLCARRLVDDMKITRVPRGVVANVMGEAVIERKDAMYLLATRGDSPRYSLLVRADQASAELCLWDFGSGAAPTSITQEQADEALASALRQGADDPFACGVLKIMYLPSYWEKKSYETFFPSRADQKLERLEKPKERGERLREVRVKKAESHETEEQLERRLVLTLADEQAPPREATYLYLRQAVGSTSPAWSAFGEKLLKEAVREAGEDVSGAWSALSERNGWEVVPFATALDALRGSTRFELTEKALATAAFLAAAAGYGRDLVSLLNTEIGGDKLGGKARELLGQAVRFRKNVVVEGESFFQSLCAEQALRAWKREQPACAPCNSWDEEKRRCQGAGFDVFPWLEGRLRTLGRHRGFGKKKARRAERDEPASEQDVVLKRAFKLAAEHAAHEGKAPVDRRMFLRLMKDVDGSKLAELVKQEALGSIYDAYDEKVQSSVR